jgi:hypothetical protein
MVNYPPLIPTIDANNNIIVHVPAGYVFSNTTGYYIDGYGYMMMPNYVYTTIYNKYLRCTISCSTLINPSFKSYQFFVSLDNNLLNLENFFNATFSKETYKNNVVEKFTITYEEVREDTTLMGVVYNNIYSDSPPVTDCPQMYEYIMKSIRTAYPSIVPTFNISTEQITINHPSNYDFDFSLSRNIFRIPKFTTSLTKNTRIDYTLECTNNKSVTFVGNPSLDVNILCSDNALSINLKNTTLVEKIILSYIEVDNRINEDYKRLKSGSPPVTDCTEITDYINITKLNNSITQISTYPVFTVNFDKSTQKINIIRPVYVFNGYYSKNTEYFSVIYFDSPKYIKVSNTDANITYTIECSTKQASGNTITTNKNYTYAEIKSIDLNTLKTDFNIDFNNTDLVTINLKYSEAQDSGFILTKSDSPKDTICTEIADYINCKKKASQLNNLPFLALYNIMNKESNTNRKNGSTYNTLSEFINSTTNTTITDVQIPTNTYFSLNTITENDGDIILHEDGLIKVIQDKDNKIMVLSKINCHTHENV